jgi:hypothetical protein
MIKKFFKIFGLPVIVIFIIALILRFYAFRESTYFGFDEARDAYSSIGIYKNFDLKLIGPAANFPGINHGPLYWYIVGPLYLLGQGSPFFVSAFFRILNALGVFLIFLIGSYLFDRKTGVIAALIFAFSFEETQYAIYYGHPALGVIAWLGIFLGASILLKSKKPIGLILMFFCTGLALQFEFVSVFASALLIVLLILLRKNFKRIPLKIWIISVTAYILAVSTYILAEIKYNFPVIKGLLNIVKSGYDVMPQGDSRPVLYIRMFTDLVRYNIFSSKETVFIYVLIIISIIFLLLLSRKSTPIKIVLAWMFAGLLLVPFAGYNAFYVNLGIGPGIILGFSIIVVKLWQKSKLFGVLVIAGILISNLLLIKRYNPDGLIVEIKAQQYMKLEDELEVVNKTYQLSGGEGFTLRVTSMPYGIQTVWAYLYNYYGVKKWGYLPFWEKEMVTGFPGELPRPKEGTTCVRFLIREPVRGIPEVLINKDVDEENLFSNIIREEKIGHFLVQYRMAKGECQKRKGGEII